MVGGRLQSARSSGLGASLVETEIRTQEATGRTALSFAPPVCEVDFYSDRFIREL